MPSLPAVSWQRMRARSVASLPVAGTAIAGVVAGHAITYIVAVRQPGHRSDILHSTGHSYWTAAIAIAMVVGLLGAAAAGLHVLRGRPVAGRLLVTRLAVVQMISYAAIEALERVLAGVPLGDLLDHHDLLPIGIAIQLAVAIAGALALSLLARTVRLVAGALRQRRRRHTHRDRGAAPVAAPVHRTRAGRGAWGLRGPPATSALPAG